MQKSQLPTLIIESQTSVASFDSDDETFTYSSEKTIAKLNQRYDIIKKSNEEKENEFIEHQYEESIVSGDDGRRKIDVFKPQSNDIYQCIGQLDVIFDYKSCHGFRGHLMGTATTIFVSHTIAYVLTCAHNIRCTVIHCTKQKCNTYRLKKKNGKKTKCCVCNEMYGRNQKQITLKATTITFRDRSIQYGNNYGKTLENYECQELFVPHTQYELFSHPKDGFDWAFLTFSDSNHEYQKRLQDININLTNGKDIFTEKYGIDRNKEYGIFGYPSDRDNKMVGMKSYNINEFSIKHNEITKQYYLHQTGIDTFEGQSGSTIWCKHNNEIQICAIHVGGSNGTKKEPTPYNIGTLINAQIMQKWEQIIMECEEEIVSRMPIPLQLQLYPQYDRQPIPPAPDTPPVDGCYVSKVFRRVQYQHKFVEVSNGTNTKSGDLKIKIHCGKSLRHLGNFASITINNITLKTKKVLPKKNPEWKEILIFNDYKPHMDNSALISIGHKCPILGEKVIGVAEFTLPIFFNHSEKMEIEISDKKNNLSGMIVLEHCLIYKENNE